ncbi:endonuclease/exonuclease/phosphatase family protein [Paracoccus niistensis]|uniref:Endonuclease/exonuclease/phosphatase family protein n=1 Tax=Paracoccus niistensis TaxID=632935 RepID=A0ABV6I254_9RHOB
MRRGLAAAALAAGLVVLGATFAGPLHPAGDSLAVGRPFLAALLVIAGLLLRGRMGWAAVAGGVVALAPILWAMRPVEKPEPGQGIVVYQKNLLYSVDDPAQIAADIRDSGADVALLQELSAQNGELTGMLADVLPHQAVCPSNTPGTVSILSRWPFQGEPYCATGVGLAWVRVALPQGEAAVASLHLDWPWPQSQPEQVAQLLPMLRDLPHPVILAGDFNAVPWSQTVASIAEATGTNRAGPLRPSFSLGGLPITIDHLLAPEGWTAVTEMRPGLGSDHQGQRATLVP